MGKRMLRGWQGPKAGRGVGSGRWGGWTGRRGNGEGWMAMGRGRQGGGDGEGSNRDRKRVAMRRRTTFVYPCNARYPSWFKLYLFFLCRVSGHKLYRSAGNV